MKKIFAVVIVLLGFAVPALAFMENSYGIYYAPIYDNGKYHIKILDVAKRSIAYKSGIRANSRIKSINGNINLTMKNLEIYFNSDNLPLVIIDDNGEQRYDLKVKNKNVVHEIEKINKNINKLILKKKYAKVLKIVNKQIKKNPYDLIARSYKINTLLLNSEYGDAINELKYLYKITKSPKILGTISSVYITMNDYDMAYKTSKEALILDPNEITANATMFICMTEKRKFNEAFEYANKLVVYAPKDYTSYLYRGIAYKNIGNLFKSYNDLNKSYNLAKKQISADFPTIIYCMVEVSELLIQKTIAGANKFVEIPSWYEICPSEYAYSTGPKQKWNVYWNGRRESYLAGVYNCVSNYKGQDLYACYASLRKKEFRLNDDYKIVREHSWNQERREEIYNYAKDILTTGLIGAYFVKTAPQTVNVRYSGGINHNVNYSGSIGHYNHYYFY